MKGTKHYAMKSDGGVEMGNTDDTHYYCVFETSEELQVFIEELKGAGKEAFGVEEDEIVVLKSVDVIDPWFPSPIPDGHTYGTLTKKCNHVIGIGWDYADRDIVQLNQCLESPRVILEINEWFDYCPKCGYELEELNQALRNVIPDDIKTIIQGDGKTFVRDSKGNEFKIPKSLTLDELRRLKHGQPRC